MEKKKYFQKDDSLDGKFEKCLDGHLIYKEDSNDYEFEGIASSYGNPDSYGDVFLAGAFDECIGKTVPIMPNHSWDITKAIGSGVISQDKNKITIKGSFLEGDETAEKIVKLKKSKVPIKLSIGGRVTESKAYTSQGKTYRGISKAEIFEVSTVFRGANPTAEITKTQGGDQMPGINEKKDFITKEDFMKEIGDLKEILTKGTQEIEKKEAGAILTKEAKEELKLMKEENEALKKSVTDLEGAVDRVIKDGGAKINVDGDLKKHLSDLNAYVKTGVRSEFVKTLSTGDASGGALLPEVRAQEIIKETYETSPVYEEARKYSTSGDSLKIRVKIKGTNNAASQAQGAAAGDESGSTYDFLELKVGKITDKQSVTQEMIDDAEFDAYSEVYEDSKENISEIISDRVWNGAYATANNLFEGIYTNTDVTGAAKETATAGVIAWEDLKDLIYAMPPKTRRKCTFKASTGAVSAMRGFQDANSRPLYVESLVDGQPDKFMGYQVKEDTFMDDVAEGKYPVLFSAGRDFYAVINKKEIYIERDRDADEDEWVIYTRTRQGGRVRQPSQGKLLKIKATV